MPGMLNNKRALITGAASGIGAATARLFSREGARLTLADLDQAAGIALSDELRAQGTAVEFLRCDVTDEPQVRQLIATAEESYGGLDCAVNCAGIPGESAPIHELSLAAWRHVLEVNLTSVFLCLKYELGVMKRQGRGAIVNVASGASLIGVPNMAGYCAAKHGVAGLSKTATLENVATGIRVNAVLPGSTRTPMLERSLAPGSATESMVRNSIPCGRFGEPDEVAEAIAWLCSDRSSYVNGEALLVDGGTVCR